LKASLTTTEGVRKDPRGVLERGARRLAGRQAIELDVAAWVHGEPTSLESLRGQTIVLAFWDSEDESSAEVIKMLNALVEKHADVAVIAVHTTEGDQDTLRQLIKEKGVTFRIAIDKPSDTHPGATFEKYEVRKPPSVYIIDTDGTVRYQDLALAVVEEAVERVIAGE